MSNPADNIMSDPSDPAHDPVVDRFVNIKQFSELCGVSRSTVENWIRSGRVRVYGQADDLNPKSARLFSSRDAHRINTERGYVRKFVPVDIAVALTVSAGILESYQEAYHGADIYLKRPDGVKTLFWAPPDLWDTFKQQSEGIDNLVGTMMGVVYDSITEGPHGGFVASHLLVDVNRVLLYSVPFDPDNEE